MQTYRLQVDKQKNKKAGKQNRHRQIGKQRARTEGWVET